MALSYLGSCDLCEGSGDDGGVTVGIRGNAFDIGREVSLCNACAKVIARWVDRRMAKAKGAP